MLKSIKLRIDRPGKEVSPADVRFHGLLHTGRMIELRAISGLKESNRWPVIEYFMTPSFPPSIASLGAISGFPSDRE